MRTAGALASAAVMALASVAHAEAPIAAREFVIEPPAGWQERPELAGSLAQSLAAQPHYDGIAVDLGVDAWVGDGAALYATWIHAREPATDAELTARRAFDTLRAAPRRASPRANSAEMVSWREDMAERVYEGELEWRHLSNETTTLARALIWITPERQLRQARAECVLPTGAQAALRATCERALASLALTATERGELGAMPGAGTIALSDGDEPPLIAVEPGRDTRAAAAGDSDQPSLRPPSEGTTVLYERERDTDSDESSALFVLGAALLVAAAYLIVRRQRS